MYRIFHSGSGIKYERIRFQDLESISQGKSSIFVPRFPIEPKTEVKGADKVADPSSNTKKVIPVEKNMDLESIMEEAYRKGKMAGILESEKNLHSAAQALGVGLEQISFLRKSLLIKSKEDMVRLIMAVARQVIHTEVKEKEDIIVNTVSKALAAAIQADKYYIRVHPEDLKIVTEKEPLFLAGMKGLQNIFFLADDTISRGGCLAESQVGEVDATIESQLNEIYEHLRKDIL